MQDAYAGDIGDYGKLALLRTIARTSLLRLGVHWWRAAASPNQRDGRFVGYLTSPEGEKRYRVPDPELYDGLRSLVVSGRRSVPGLQGLALLPKETRYFGELLSYAGVRLESREAHRSAWLARSLDALDGSDVLLLDPDNGLETDSVSIRRIGALKYVFRQEAEVLAKGRSLILYQHIARNGDARTQIARRLRVLGEKPGPFAVQHHRGTSRAYLFFPRPEHRPVLQHAVEVLIARWRRDYTLITT